MTMMMIMVSAEFKEKSRWELPAQIAGASRPSAKVSILNQTDR